MKYEIEFRSTTFRTYSVEAPSRNEAEEKAEQELENDETVSKAWSENSEIIGVRHG